MHCVNIFFSTNCMLGQIIIYLAKKKKKPFFFQYVWKRRNKPIINWLPKPNGDEIKKLKNKKNKMTCHWPYRRMPRCWPMAPNELHIVRLMYRMTILTAAKMRGKEIFLSDVTPLFGLQNIFMSFDYMADKLLFHNWNKR